MVSASNKADTGKDNKSHWKAIFISLVIAHIALHPRVFLDYVVWALFIIPINLLPSVFTESLQWGIAVMARVFSDFAYTLLPFIDLTAVSLYINRRRPKGKAKVTSYVVLNLLVLYLISYHIIYSLWSAYAFDSPVSSQGWGMPEIVVVYSAIVYFLLPLIVLIALSLYITQRHPEGKARVASYVIVTLVISWIILGILIVEPNPTLQILYHKYIARDYGIWIKNSTPTPSQNYIPTPTPSLF